MSIQVSDRKFSDDQIDLVKNTVAKGCTDSELQLFLYTCSRTGLDPLMKQIHAIKRKTKIKEQNSWKEMEVMTMQTSIDGLRAIAERTKRYAPGKETIYQYSENNRIVSATAYVKKMTEDGSWHEVGVTAFFEEYAQYFNGELSKFWKQFGHVMIAKCAEALCLRKAFPFELSGIYSNEEMLNPLNKSNEEESLLDQTEMIKHEEQIKKSIPQEPEIVLDLPKDVDPLDAEAYIIVSAKAYKTTPNILKRNASRNMDKFISLLKEWRALNPRIATDSSFDPQQLEMV